VAFDIIDEYRFPQRVKDGHVFTLHESHDAAKEEMISDASSGKYQYVIHFSESVRGLSRGAPVEYRGVRIGRVSEIKLAYDSTAGSVSVPVYIELQPERVAGFQADDREEIQLINDAIAKGLRAKLQTGNLLTGQLYVALDIYESEEAEPLTRDAEGIAIMPSIDSDLTQVTDGVKDALSMINALPLPELLDNANSAVAQVDKLVTQFEQIQLASKVDGAIGSADDAIKKYEALAESTRFELGRVAKQLRGFVATANESVAGIAPDSPLYYNLLNTLRDLQAASRAVLAVSESVEKKPEEFLFGK